MAQAPTIAAAAVASPLPAEGQVTSSCSAAADAATVAAPAVATKLPAGGQVSSCGRAAAGQHPAPGAPQNSAEIQSATAGGAAVRHKLAQLAPRTPVETQDAAAGGRAVAGSSAAPAPLQAPAGCSPRPAQPLQTCAQPQWQVPDLSVPPLDLAPQQAAAAVGAHLTAAVATQLRSLEPAGRGAGPEGLWQEAVSKHAACMAAELWAQQAVAMFAQKQVRRKA